MSSETIPRSLTLKAGELVDVRSREEILSTLDENAAAQFDRTDADRSKGKDDTALARMLARELGGLALGLSRPARISRPIASALRAI